MRRAVQLDRDGRALEAVAAYRDVLARWPNACDCWYSLAVLQRKLGQFPQALASYQQALDRGVRRPEEVHLNRGVIFSDHLRQDELAERELHAALAINPDYVPALLNLANLHEDLGRREQAAALYERILALDPEHYEALARYANMHAFGDPDDPIIAWVKEALDKPRVAPAERASLGFALGRALDLCGSYDAAFNAYAQANRDSRESAPDGVRHDRSLEERFFARLRASFPTRRETPMPEGRPRPVFVCGMFRSGSTLIEQMLAGHPRISPGGELDLLPRLASGALAPFPESMDTMPISRLRELATRYRGTLASLHPQAEVVTDKRPDNFIYIGLIKTLFPDAKIVHTVRDPLDNCLSIFFLHLDHRMRYALDLMDIGHHYRQYRQIMRHWKDLYGEDVLDVSYDALVREPQPQIERLLAFLKLEWDPNCLTVPARGRAIKTASVWQAREPLYLRSSGRARHYKQHLHELIEYLQQPD